MKELARNGVPRSEIVLATKGGFIPFDGAPPDDVRSYFLKMFIEPGIVKAGDIVSGCHCMMPAYLLDQLDYSLRNLSVQCIDFYYVHNPESQLAEVPRSEFNWRLQTAFEASEEAVSASNIRMYGTATWNGYRNDPGAKDYLSLEDVIAIARKVGGDDHHFKVIQLPLNLGMEQALPLRNHSLRGRC